MALLPTLEEDLRGQVGRGSLHALHPLGGVQLADAIVSELDVNSTFGVPLCLWFGELPEENVSWLEVLVDDGMGMEVVQCPSNLL